MALAMKRRFGISRQRQAGVDHTFDVEGKGHGQKKGKKFHRVKIGSLTYLMISAGTISMAILKNVARPSSPAKPVSISYTPPSNVTNKLLSMFERNMSSAELTLSPEWDSHVPLILEGGKILCRRSHREVMSNPRIRAFVEMLGIGLEMNNDGNLRTKYNKDGYGAAGLPIMLLESDHNGCDVHEHVDLLSFPRLTWSAPSPKFGDGWCRAVSIPCYESWHAFRHRGTWLGWSWDHTFKTNERKYPWTSKIDKAVWRGSTTSAPHYSKEHAIKHGLPSPNFSDIPRARLVERSMKRPDLIDAGFTSFVQDWESRKTELEGRTIEAQNIPFDDQMEYRAVIDIDGNMWSSRFAKLLCLNSVVIKIDPDYIEYFYADLKPMVHYVPASLENITVVASHVLDEKNRREMKSIVDAANSWCKKTNTIQQLPKDAISRLRTYEAAIYDAYNRSVWVNEWKHVRRRIAEYVGEDLVDCPSMVSYLR